MTDDTLPTYREKPIHSVRDHVRELQAVTGERFEWLAEFTGEVICFSNLATAAFSEVFRTQEALMRSDLALMGLLQLQSARIAALEAEVERLKGDPR